MTDDAREQRIAALLAIIESDLTPSQRYELERLRRRDRAVVRQTAPQDIIEATDEQIREARRLFDLETARVKGEALSDENHTTGRRAGTARGARRRSGRRRRAE